MEFSNYFNIESFYSWILLLSNKCTVYTNSITSLNIVHKNFNSFKIKVINFKIFKRKLMLTLLALWILL